MPRKLYGKHLILWIVFFSGVAQFATAKGQSWGVGRFPARGNNGWISQRIGLTDSSVLRNFSIHYRGKDFGAHDYAHQVRDVGVLRRHEEVVINLHDEDQKEAIGSRGAYHNTWRVTPTIRLEIRDRCNETQCRGNIPHYPGTVPVLQGFRLEFADGSDHELTHVLVDLQPLRNADGQHRLIVGLGEHDDYKPFNYWVQIVWVPTSNLQNFHLHQATGVSRSRFVMRESPERVAILKGFGCWYVHSNGSHDSHNIERIGVNPNFITNRDRSLVYWEYDDGDKDDWINCFVNMALLR